PDRLRRIVTSLLGHLVHERSPRLVAREPGRLLELPAHVLDELLLLAAELAGLVVAPLELLLPTLQLAVAFGEALEPLRDRLFLLRDPSLGAGRLAPDLLGFALGVAFRAEHDVLGLQLGLATHRLAFLAGLLDDAGGRVVHRLLRLLSLLVASSEVGV